MLILLHLPRGPSQGFHFSQSFHDQPSQTLMMARYEYYLFFYQEILLAKVATLSVNQCDLEIDKTLIMQKDYRRLEEKKEEKMLGS